MKSRKQVVQDLYDWYENRGGKYFLKKHTNIADFVDNYYKTTKHTKEVSGVYVIKFNNIPFGVGESSQMWLRFLEHMKNLKDDGVLFWGVDPFNVENGTVNLKIEILEDNILEESDRKERESEKIKELKPILQVRYDKYYPKDKAFKEHGVWQDREDIRIDQYIRRKLREERASEAMKVKK